MLENGLYFLVIYEIFIPKNVPCLNVASCNVYGEDLSTLYLRIYVTV